MIKKRPSPPQYLLKFNFFDCFFFKFFQAKKLKSAKKGSPPPSVMYFISFYTSPWLNAVLLFDFLISKWRKASLLNAIV